MGYRAGRHFLQIPGPTNVPDRILRAIDRPTIDHRGPSFAALTNDVLTGLAEIYRTDSAVVIYAASGTGAWEAALVNTLSPGDKVLMVETGQFATLWCTMARRLGLVVEFIPGEWGRGIDSARIGESLAADTEHTIKAVCCVHNETSTGVTSRIDRVRAVLDEHAHPALLMVDAISSLGALEYRHDEWGVDVTIAGSQKGMMLPPGLGFNAISAKALAASESATMPRSYWDWQAMLKMTATGYFPFTPATNMLFGLREAIEMLREEGLAQVHQRHARLAHATRSAVQAWGLELLCAHRDEASDAVTAIVMPRGHSADALRALILERFNMSLGNGLARLADKVFRIGHLGDLNELSLAGVLSGVEMGLRLNAVPYRPGGVQAALDTLVD